MSTASKWFRLSPRSMRLVVLLAFGASIPLALASCGGDGVPSPSGEEGASSPSSGSIPYRLTKDGKALAGPGGKRIPLRSGAVGGFVDNVIPEGDAINLTGWAAAGDNSGPAQQVVGIVGGAGVGHARPISKRPDVVKEYGEAAIEKSGFTLFLDTATLECSATAGGLTVFGIADGVAGPLAFVGSSEGELDAVC
jgi:hypothetical protein